MRKYILLVAAVVLACSCGNVAKTKTGSGAVPRFADLTLCYGGGLAKQPARWTPERFQSHVSYVDAAGAEHWLYEAFLFIDDRDGVSGRGLSLTPDPGSRNGTKQSWANFMDYWLAPDGAISSLAESIEATAGRIGAPPCKRVVVMTMPDPVQFECFADKSSSTVYWGDGLDFSKSEDQVKAYRWFIDECRKRFALCKSPYLELGGFYILSEDLVAKPEGLNYKYKRWDQILPHVSQYLHSLGLGMYWIPWNFAPGYDMVRELGIDMAWMQPNSYWDENGDKPMDRTMEAILRYGLSMEFEFEYSICTATMKKPGMRAPDAQWRMTRTIDDVPAFKARFREYMKAFKDYGLYGVKPIAVYSGTDTMYQLAHSQEPDDVELYRELCQYIIDSPLRAGK